MMYVCMTDIAPPADCLLLCGVDSFPGGSRREQWHKELARRADSRECKGSGGMRGFTQSVQRWLVTHERLFVVDSGRPLTRALFVRLDRSNRVVAEVMADGDP